MFLLCWTLAMLDLQYNYYLACLDNRERTYVVIHTCIQIRTFIIMFVLVLHDIDIFYARYIIINISSLIYRDITKYDDIC